MPEPQLTDAEVLLIQETAGLFPVRILQVRATEYGPDYLLEGQDHSGCPLRGWWLDGESLGDIRWDGENVDGWPARLRFEGDINA